MEIGPPLGSQLAKNGGHLFSMLSALLTRLLLPITRPEHLLAQLTPEAGATEAVPQLDSQRDTGKDTQCDSRLVALYRPLL